MIQSHASPFTSATLQQRLIALETSRLLTKKKRVAEYNTFLGNSGVKRQNLGGQEEQRKGQNRHICEAL